jgi:hypothetical protein
MGIGLPNISETFWTKGRAKTSPAAPASKGTMKVIGFAGYGSAARTSLTLKSTPDNTRNEIANIDFLI